MNVVNVMFCDTWNFEMLSKVCVLLRVYTHTHILKYGLIAEIQDAEFAETKAEPVPSLVVVNKTFCFFQLENFQKKKS